MNQEAVERYRLLSLPLPLQREVIQVELSPSKYSVPDPGLFGHLDPDPERAKHRPKSSENQNKILNFSILGQIQAGPGS